VQPIGFTWQQNEQRKKPGPFKAIEAGGKGSHGVEGIRGTPREAPSWANTGGEE